MSANIWDQLTLDGSSPKVTTRRSDDTCTACRATVRRIVADTPGWPAVVTQHPVDRVTALAAVVAGRPVYVHVRHRRDATWWPLTADTIGSDHLAVGDHHLEHRCGHDPPAPPPKPAAADLPDTPPF